MTETRYTADHDGQTAYVFDNVTKLRARFPDSAAAYKVSQWLEQGINLPEHYTWTRGANSVYVDLGTGSWGGAADIVTLELSDIELEQLQDMSDSEIIEFAHTKHHAQQQKEIS